ncbi:MAG: hypothetical protein GX567_06590 [Clostridia bacterium]|nr:hypothetical protein [Clostridia bacterium]
MFLFGKSKESDNFREKNEKERKESEQKQSKKENKSEWDKLIEGDALGFFDD